MRENQLWLVELLLKRFPESDCFRDLLDFAWHTGCRPQEACLLEPRHVRLADKAVVLPKEEAKGKRWARVILLDAVALAIVTRLVPLWPEGQRLFLNEDGRPWKRFAIANRFDRFQLALGIEELKRLGIMIPPLPRFDRRKFPDDLGFEVAHLAFQFGNAPLVRLACGQGLRAVFRPVWALRNVVDGCHADSS